MNNKEKDELAAFYDCASPQGRKAIMAFARGEAARERARQEAVKPRKPTLLVVVSRSPGARQVRDLVADKVQDHRPIVSGELSVKRN